ncbi:MAG: hypothetical protein A2932_00880 [Candidatus Spechtbacteria bacterium RIFCSPLOWO2_01_FULL_46_10]|uniref:Uncharacterized protein n=1 Tax=Candidatus Spechtbacteria bacterium RIFCSPLOWO2_01_FULL_46_10 TaxID=1802163 RepID=A0A1G2HIE8_9BACT|nr:MAG: hypothetical protein A2932_00880 [Candidatus Spechtbacteria bacterium RIFCSPLOWO2_01_FULL_46_10]
MQPYKLFVPPGRQYRAWVSGKYLKLVEEMLAVVEGKRVDAQLRQLRVHNFLVLYSLAERARYMKKDGHFEIWLRPDRVEHWPVDTGHEIGHIILVDKQEGMSDEEVEATCEWFAWNWAADPFNTRELMDLLQLLVPSGDGLTDE